MPQRRPRPRAAVRAAALASLGLLGILAGCSGGPAGPAASMPDPTSASTSARAVAPAPSPAPLETVSSHRLSPVYWLGERDQTVYLYREFQQAEDQGDPITTSIKYMLENQPTDPDYFSLWRPASRIGTSIGSGNTITVDLSADAFGRTMDEGLARRSIQQLVHTATAAAANAGLLSGTTPASVVILVDGRPGYTAFGHVPLEGPIERSPRLRAPVWIIDPQEGATLPDGSVRVHGVTSGYPGGTQWEVRRLGEDGEPGETVAGGRLATGTGDLPDNGFEVGVPLGPGRYEVAVWGQGGTGAARLGVDDKRFEVR